MLTVTPTAQPRSAAATDRLRTRITTLEAELAAARAELAAAEQRTDPRAGWYVHWVGSPGQRMGWLHRTARSCWWVAPGPDRAVMSHEEATELWRRERRRLRLCEICARR